MKKFSSSAIKALLLAVTLFLSAGAYAESETVLIPDVPLVSDPSADVSSFFGLVKEASRLSDKIDEIAFKQCGWNKKDYDANKGYGDQTNLIIQQDKEGDITLRIHVQQQIPRSICPVQ